MLSVLRHRLLAKVQERPGTLATPCLIWVGARCHGAYGHFTYERRQWLAHRVAWMVFVGPIPEGMWVLHKCDRPPCCNVEHLFLGTPSDNTTDMWRKRRAWRQREQSSACNEDHSDGLFL